MSGKKPRSAFLRAWSSLLLLLGASLAFTTLANGALQRWAPIAIAATQAAIIMAVFMKLRERPSLSWVFAGAGFFWLFILIALSATDYLTRAGWPS